MTTRDEDGKRSGGVLRVLTALVGAPIVLFAAYLGGPWFTGLVALIGLAAMFEVGRMFEAANVPPFWPVAFVLAVGVATRFLFPGWTYLSAAAAVAALAGLPFIKSGRLPERAAVTLFVVVYPVWLLTFLVMIREGVGIDRSGDELMRVTILLILLVWASDTFAYYSGRLIGTRPFFPSISPKKTWEGFFGGMIGTVAVAVAAKVLVLVALSWPEIAAIALIVTVLGPIGDLVESKLKRSFHTKDSGDILPGHGGFLDRFDAMLLCAPAVWLFLSVVF